MSAPNVPTAGGLVIRVRSLSPPQLRAVVDAKNECHLRNAVLVLNGPACSTASVREPRAAGCRIRLVHEVGHFLRTAARSRKISDQEGKSSDSAEFLEKLVDLTVAGPPIFTARVDESNQAE